MNVPLIDDIAAHIRRVDGDNKLDSNILGQRIAEQFLPEADRRVGDLAGYVGFINADKSMGAGALAEAVVAEFELTEAA